MMNRALLVNMHQAVQKLLENLKKNYTNYRQKTDSITNEET